MKRKLCICLIVAAGSVAAFASQPIATVSSSSSFELDGSTVNTAGVSSWPLMAGDRVSARDSALVISMKDGSRITLAANSQMRFESASIEPTANLISGAMQFTLATGSNLRVLRAGTTVGGRSGVVGAQGAGPQLLKPPPAKPPSPVSSR